MCPNGGHLFGQRGRAAASDRRALDLAGAIAPAEDWCPWLIVKRGPKGAIAVDRGQATEVSEGLLDVMVRDRTGAGDAFAGALSAKSSVGQAFSRPWRRATRPGRKPWPGWARPVSCRSRDWSRDLGTGRTLKGKC